MVPLSALTAFQALFTHGDFKGLDDQNAAGKSILVNAAAGGVGVWLVQMARIAGMKVIAQIGSVKNNEFVRGLGASKTVNYRTESLKEWAERENPVDVVIDGIGGKTLEDAWFSVEEGGTLISIRELLEGRRPEILKKKLVRNEFFIMKPNSQQLAEVSRLVDEGQCVPVVDSVWKFEDYQGAFDRLDGGHATGKVVLKVT